MLTLTLQRVCKRLSTRSKQGTGEHRTTEQGRSPSTETQQTNWA